MKSIGQQMTDAMVLGGFAVIDDFGQSFDGAARKVRVAFPNGCTDLIRLQIART